MRAIKVLIVDDSAVVRQVLSDTLAQDTSIELIGAMEDPLFAIEFMRGQWPDVIVLDVEMPRMDGITFLKKIMAERPTPVVICSAFTEKGAFITMQALQAGAFSIITKPKFGLKRFFEDSSNDLISTIKAASHANARKLVPLSALSTPSRKLSADVILSAATHTSHSIVKTTDRIVAIGTSTGGTQALELVLTALPKICPGIVIVQHMPEKFTGTFAARLNDLCQIEVREAKNGDRVMPGLALLAPGGRHMLLKRNGSQYQVEIVDGPPVSRHRPSVDVLFRSVSKAAGKNALGIIMTGMGDDGANGLLEMRNEGAYTIGQDEQSCVVYGMPKEAVKRGAVIKTLALRAIAGAISGLDR
ncbi:MAG: chemotaxis response regulator protein-glutamate methylesterase [Gallionellaceae bacterium]